MITVFQIILEGERREEYLIAGPVGKHLSLLIEQLAKEQMEDETLKGQFALFIAQHRM
jgi:hypothetical protein